jgi:GNAT superfamily N-acetyltransferase
MSQIIIRKAQIKDAPAIADLAGQLGYPTAPDQAAIRLGYLLDRIDSAILVAVRDSESLVGWIQVFDLLLLEAQPAAEIGGLVVDQTQRGEGIGQALVKAAEDWAVGRGHAILLVRSNAIRSDAHRFYTGLGFRQLKTQFVFSKDIQTG